MVDNENGVRDELASKEKMAAIIGNAALTKTPKPVRWKMIWAIALALLFLFFWVSDRFYASLP